MVEEARNSSRARDGERRSSSPFFFLLSFCFLEKKSERHKLFKGRREREKKNPSSVSGFRPTLSASIQKKHDELGCSAAPSASEAPAPRAARDNGSSRRRTRTGAETEEEEQQSSPPCSTPPTTTTMEPWRLRGAQMAALLVKRTSLRPPLVRSREREGEREGERVKEGKARGHAREQTEPIDQKGAPRSFAQPLLPSSVLETPIPAQKQNAAEHAARVRAEGAAADASRRLEVAQEQVHEYARARAQDAAEALAEAEAAVARASSSSSESSAQPALASLVALRDRLAQASEEAAAFAELTRADAERARRSAAAAAEAAASGGGGALSSCAAANAGAAAAAAATAAQEEDEDGDVDMETSAAAGPDAKRARESGGEGEEETAATEGGGASSAAAPLSSSSSVSSQTMLERARYIPLRLTADERRMLALLKAALGVSQARGKKLFCFFSFFSLFSTMPHSLVHLSQAHPPPPPPLFFPLSISPQNKTKQTTVHRQGRRAVVAVQAGQGHRADKRHVRHPLRAGRRLGLQARAAAGGRARLRGQRRVLQGLLRGREEAQGELVVVVVRGGRRGRREGGREGKGGSEREEREVFFSSFSLSNLLLLQHQQHQNKHRS